ncbi:MAG: metallophosphoesterase [Pseudomonadota bacterium]
MKIIAFGDIHEDLGNVIKIPGLTEADLVLVTGDLTNFGGVSKAREIIEGIRQYNKNLYAQPGNLDKKEVGDYLNELGVNLHGKGVIFGSLGIFGLGGSNPTPFNTPLEYSEQEIAGFLLKGFKDVEDAPVKILISHAPPHNTAADQVKAGLHVGSSSVREFLEKHDIKACITGHIHEAVCLEVLGRTTVVNPGMLKNGGYVEIVEEQGAVDVYLRHV